MYFLLPFSLIKLFPLLTYTRRGFPTEKCPTGTFFTPPALLLRGFRPPRRANRGLAPVPRHFLKKVDENFTVQHFLQGDFFDTLPIPA